VASLWTAGISFSNNGHDLVDLESSFILQLRMSFLPYRSLVESSQKTNNGGDTELSAAYVSADYQLSLLIAHIPSEFKLLLLLVFFYIMIIYFI
jgi:hypothetical protein